MRAEWRNIARERSGMETRAKLTTQSDEERNNGRVCQNAGNLSNWRSDTALRLRRQRNDESADDEEREADVEQAECALQAQMIMAHSV